MLVADKPVTALRTALEMLMKTPMSATAAKCANLALSAVPPELAAHLDECHPDNDLGSVDYQDENMGTLQYVQETTVGVTPSNEGIPRFLLRGQPSDALLYGEVYYIRGGPPTPSPSQFRALMRPAA